MISVEPAEVMLSIIKASTMVPSGWGLVKSLQPDTPANMVTIYWTGYVPDVRSMRTGEQDRKESFMVRIRGNKGMAQIAINLINYLERHTRIKVTVGGVQVMMESWSTTSGPMDLGPAAEQPKLTVVNFNGTATLTEV